MPLKFLTNPCVFSQTTCIFVRLILKMMKDQRLPKSSLLLVTLFSLCAFVFVNLNAGTAKCQPNATGQCVPTQVVRDSEEAEKEGIKVPPSVAIVSRLIELGQRYLSR